MSNPRHFDPNSGNLVLHDSSTTALEAAATWTSKTDVEIHTTQVTGSVFTDQASTLYVDQSPDGTNWDVSDSYAVSASSGVGFTVEKVAAYTRVRLLCGATPQTTLRIYVYRRVR